MAKKYLIVLVVIIIPLVLWFWFEKFQEKDMNREEINNLTEHQQQSIREDLEGIEQVSSTADQKEVEDYIINQTLISSDNALKSAFGDSGVRAAAEIYRGSNGNYGASSSQNVCTDSIMISALNSINQRTKPGAICTLGPTFPTTTFTVTAKANTEPGYFCTDHVDFAGVIDITSSSFKSGIQCK